MSIGERIISLRKAEKLSQGQLASLLDVTRQAVSKWENDQSSPDTIKLIQLADVLNTEVEYLATGKKSEPVIVKTVEYQEKVVEKVVEKPIVKVIDKIVEKPVPKYIDRVVEKPVLKRVVRVKYYRNPFELAALALGFLLIGFILGKFL